MRMFKNSKFICSNAGCKQSFPLEKIHHHEMNECNERCIRCPAPYCQFTNKLETELNHTIKCLFHLIYCGGCNTLSNLAVLTHDCKEINAQQTLPSKLKYFYEHPPPNHLHGDVFLGTHLFNESFEGCNKIRYYLFMRDAYSFSQPLHILPLRILQRHNGVEDLSFHNTFS